MASLQLDTLKPEDVQKILRFMYILNDSFDDFENATLTALEDIFGYPISTYTIFDEDIDGNFFISKNNSNFFRKRELDQYDSSSYKDDVALKKAVENRAVNSSKYVIVTEYDHLSVNRFDRIMIAAGIKYQIRLGANTKINPPVHVLSVYKTVLAEPLDDYEMELLGAIGNVFSRCVGVYTERQRFELQYFIPSLCRLSRKYCQYQELCLPSYRGASEDR